jgi:UDP-glucose 4-epimerase
MKILVTGGAGFIGKHLVKYFLDNNNSVTIFDNFSNSTRKSINHLIKKGAKIIEGDITKILDLEKITKDHEIVIHLAAKISVSESISNPSKTFLVNVNGTRNILEVCKKNNFKHIIIASSAAVYGEGVEDIKLKENQKLKPISPYGESKMKMEQEIEMFLKNKNITYTILRFFNIYGPNQSDEYAGVISKFLKKIKQNENLEIFGDGSQTRDFVSINDIVNSINYAMQQQKSGIYNIGSGKSITIKELAEKIIFLSKKKLKILYFNTKNNEIKYSQALIESSKTDLKYSPKINLDKGIKELLDI